MAGQPWTFTKIRDSLQKGFHIEFPYMKDFKSNTADAAPWYLNEGGGMADNPTYDCSYKHTSCFDRLFEKDRGSSKVLQQYTCDEYQMRWIESTVLL